MPMQTTFPRAQRRTRSPRSLDAWRRGTGLDESAQESLFRCLKGTALRSLGQFMVSRSVRRLQTLYETQNITA